VRAKNILPNWLTNRYQLVVRNEENLEERVTFGFSYVKLIALSILTFTSLVACSLGLATTILVKWLHPTYYIEQENKNKIIQLSIAVDALEEQTTQQKNLITALQHIIAGKEPPTVKELTTKNKKTPKVVSPTHTLEQRAATDAQLRREFEQPVPSSELTNGRKSLTK